MIPRGCLMRVIDNSGARLAEVIGFYGQQGQYGYVGDVVKVAIKDAKGEKVQAGTTKKAVITGALIFCYWECVKEGLAVWQQRLWSAPAARLPGCTPSPSMQACTILW